MASATVGSAGTSRLKGRSRRRRPTAMRRRTSARLEDVCWRTYSCTRARVTAEFASDQYAADIFAPTTLMRSMRRSTSAPNRALDVRIALHVEYFDGVVPQRRDIEALRSEIDGKMVDAPLDARKFNRAHETERRLSRSGLKSREHERR